MEVNKLECDHVETELHYTRRISPNFPSAPFSLSLSDSVVLSVQMAHINKADSHTSVNNLFISPSTTDTQEESTRALTLSSSSPPPLLLSSSRSVSRTARLRARGTVSLKQTLTVWWISL